MRRSGDYASTKKVKFYKKKMHFYLFYKILKLGELDWGIKNMMGVDTQK